MNNRNLVKGVALVALALAFGLAAMRYPIGSFEQAGPGLFPVLVSSIMFVLGAATLVRAFFMDPEPISFNLLNISVILSSLCGFTLISEYVNMTAGIIFLVFCSTVAGTSYSLWRNVKIAAVLIAIAFGFVHGLGLGLPLY